MYEDLAAAEAPAPLVRCHDHQPDERTMNMLLKLAVLSSMSLPLAAQASTQFSVELQVDHDARLATMTSDEQRPFFGFMVAATKDTMLDVGGFGGLLVYEAVVATALCMNGVMVLDLGPGGWGFDVYLQGAAISESGAALTGVEIVLDRAIEAGA
jgi:hypothetical protein